ncbi:MAG: hypothetical protein KGO92_15895, partial [Bacteroidota bacterium]|nr:hypothetical protein [Bacteroidota bacterium]
IFPAACPDSLIVEDLKTTLQSASPLMGSWQKRVLPCYELVTGSSRPEISQFAHPVFKPDGQSGNLLLQGYTLPALTTLFNDAAKPSPGKPITLNETGIDYPVDLVIPARALNDPDLLQQSLIKYHLKLIPTIRPLSVFVLTENPSYNNH